MNVTLDDAWEKLRWSKHHFEILRSQIEPFEQRGTHSISVEVDAAAGKYTFYVHGLDVTDPDWGLMIGDCLHNARTALDYLMVRLWALVTGDDPASVAAVQFPIYNDQKMFVSAVGKFRKELAFSGYLARVEELQPFQAGNPSIWGVRTPFPSIPFALDRLSFLDNIDKHRVPYATWLAVQFGGWFNIDRDAPEGFTPIGGGVPIDPLKDGAEVGEYTFEVPLPSDWKPTEVQMKGYFPLQVAFPEPSPVKRVLEILPWCISGAEAVLEIFRPVFEQGAPPLPVTAAKTTRG